MVERWAVIVHGGCKPVAPEDVAANRQGLERAIRAASALLAAGGGAVEAAAAAVRSLEDNPVFNAGNGSAPNADGVAEMDASIMEGDQLNVGAVGACRRSQIRSSSPKPCSGTKQCYAWGKARCVSPLSAALRGRAWRSAAGAAPRTTPSDASRSTAEEPWPRPLPLGAWRALRPDASATHVFQGADSTPIVGLARCRPPATANALRV